jgi:aromatic-L-amino-acid decarboxylase
MAGAGDHMSPEDFRRHGHALVDWVAEYLEHAGERPVHSEVRPGWVREQLPPHPPEHGEPFEDMLADVDRIVMPGLTHWQAPGFMGYFPANSSAPSVLGELLSAGLGVQGMLWSTSPACTEVETHMLDWLVDLLDLPDAFRSAAAVGTPPVDTPAENTPARETGVAGSAAAAPGFGGGVIQDSASSATLVALLAARERATGWSSNQRGLDRPLTVYASVHAHSALEKAVRIAGLGSDRLRLVEVDGAQAMLPEALDRAMTADAEAGSVPCMVLATVGTTSSHAMDPLRAIGEVAREHGAWLHVDAAHAGAFAVCPELRWIHDGLELADSYCFNPHKQLFVNFDCTAFYVTDRAALIRTLSVLPEFLRNRASDSGAVIDYRDWQVPLGRRFRALKLWFTLRHYGADGLRRHLRAYVELARELADRVEAHPSLELAAPVPLNLVCVRHRDGDAATQRLLDHANASGDVYLTHTRLDGKLTARVSIGGTHTGRTEVERVWKLLDAAATA